MQYASIPDALHLEGSPNREEFGGRCPFHRDRRPSFSFNMDTGLWVCYAGCGGGTVEQLVERILELNPHQAALWVRQNALPLGREHLTSSAISGTSAVEEPSALPPFPQTQTPVLLAAVPRWFLERGFTLETARAHGLRYAKDSQALYIPVASGYVLRLPPGMAPKYINSPGLTDPYLVVGEQKNPLFIVEGPLDALWLNQHGYSALALLGGRMTDSIFVPIRLFDPEEVVIATDNDMPGKTLAHKLYPQLLSRGYRCTQLTLPEGIKDVQELDSEELVDAIRHRSSPPPYPHGTSDRVHFNRPSHFGSGHHNRHN